MEQIHSSEKEITAPQRVVFDVLSNVDNLTRLYVAVPKENGEDEEELYFVIYDNDEFALPEVFDGFFGGIESEFFHFPYTLLLYIWDMILSLVWRMVRRSL